MTNQPWGPGEQEAPALPTQSTPNGPAVPSAGQSQALGDTSQPISDIQRLTQRYHAPDNGWDECVDASGAVRPQWHGLYSTLDDLGVTGLSRRSKQIRRQLRRNGIAYSSYGDPKSRAHHLNLDPLPFVIPAAQWETIERGVSERATLMNLLLKDLYGPRTLIRTGVLPAELLFTHPRYRLMFHELLSKQPQAQPLHFYSAELGRASNGAWWVLGDRSDTFGGCGFALENRISTSRAFSPTFRQSNVYRLACYFIAMREHLVSLASHRSEHPRIAILTGGAGHATYFEDAYLAKYLDFQLVESADLSVRDNHLMMKTIGGLDQVDIVVRRYDGEFIDPLEMGGNVPGIAGILQVIRDGNVNVVNMPGSAIAESPVFMAFMPQIAKALLGKELQLPGVATWWGGHPESLNRIIDRLDDLVLFPTFWNPNQDPAPLSGTVHDLMLPREQRIAMLKENPSKWVAQEKFQLSSTAVWRDDTLQSGYLSMRSFACAKGDSWNVMPGGLVRITAQDHPVSLRLFRDGHSKDAWVMSDEPVEIASLLTPPAELKLVRHNPYVPSRLADNFCWLGRNLERIEAAARLMRGVLVRLTGESDPSEMRELPTLVTALAVEGRIDESFSIDVFRKNMKDFDALLIRSYFDRDQPGSTRSLIDNAYFQATKVRERLAPDEWRVFQSLGELLDSTSPANCDLNELFEINEGLIMVLAAFGGLANDSMTRSDSLRFLNIGRRLESALQIVSLLHSCFSNPRRIYNEVLEAVLEVQDSIMTYRSRYYANFQIAAVIDLLLLDESNPRSLAFQLATLDSNIASLPGNEDGSMLSAERRLSMDILHLVRMANARQLSELRPADGGLKLMTLLDEVRRQLPKIATLISNRYLVHAGPVQQLVADRFNLH